MAARPPPTPPPPAIAADAPLGQVLLADFRALWGDAKPHVKRIGSRLPPRGRKAVKGGRYLIEMLLDDDEE